MEVIAGIIFLILVVVAVFYIVTAGMGKRGFWPMFLVFAVLVIGGAAISKFTGLTPVVGEFLTGIFTVEDRAKAKNEQTISELLFMMNQHFLPAAGAYYGENHHLVKRGDRKIPLTIDVYLDTNGLIGEVVFRLPKHYAAQEGSMHAGGFFKNQYLSWMINSPSLRLDRVVCTVQPYEQQPKEYGYYLVKDGDLLTRTLDSYPNFKCESYELLDNLSDMAPVSPPDARYLHGMMPGFEYMPMVITPKVDCSRTADPALCRAMRHNVPSP